MRKPLSTHYIKQVGNWVWQGKFYILSILAIFSTTLYLIGVLNFYPNFVSLAMTIGGLLILLKLQMLDAREFTDQRPKTLRTWITSFPAIKPINISSSSISLLSTASLKAHPKVSRPENDTIENKVQFLLRQVDEIQDRIVNVNTRIDNVEASLTKEIKELTTSLHSLDASLKAIIAGHAVGTYDLNFFGIIITLCGTVIQFFTTQKV